MRRHEATRWTAGTLVLALALAPPILAAEKAAPRPEEWAQPIPLAGAPNLHKVTDTLYRGAQPTREGFRNLEKLGVKTDFNLRLSHSDRKLLEGIEIDYLHVPMAAWRVREDHILEFLKAATDPTRQPLFVHCQHGADRTGTMVAFYRMVVQGWSKDDAIREMTEGGFGFHEVWSNLIRLIREADIERLKKKLEASRNR